MSLSCTPASVNPSFVPAWSTTATPDWVFDDVAPDLAKAPLKVLLYIVRRTSGFRKSADAISLSQFQHGITTRDGRPLDKGAGVKNRTTLLRALADLEARGLIGHQDALRDDGGHATTVYYLRGPGQGEGATSATNRKIERSVPPTPTETKLGDACFHEAPAAPADQAVRIASDDAQCAGDLAHAAAASTPPDPKPTTAATPAQPRIDADYQTLAGPIAALVERLGDGAPPWASVSRGYGLMTRAGLAVPVFLALLAEAELLMRPSLPHIEKPMAYLFRVVESLMRQDDPPRPPQPPRATTRPRSSPPSPTLPAPEQTADAWGQVRAEIAREVTPDNYARWFAPTQQLADAGDMLTVAITGGDAPAFHQQWLDRRLRGLIERCAARVRPGLHLAFVVEACALPRVPVDDAR